MKDTHNTSIKRYIYMRINGTMDKWNKWKWGKFSESRKPKYLVKQKRERVLRIIRCFYIYAWYRPFSSHSQEIRFPPWKMFWDRTELQGNTWEKFSYLRHDSLLLSASYCIPTSRFGTSHSSFRGNSFPSIFLRETGKRCVNTQGDDINFQIVKG